MRKHLEQVEKTTGKKPKELEEIPEPPEEILYILTWYYCLHTNNPLTYTEIKAWNDLVMMDIKPWEADLLISIDKIYWRIMNA